MIRRGPGKHGVGVLGGGCRSKPQTRQQPRGMNSRELSGNAGQIVRRNKRMTRGGPCEAGRSADRHIAGRWPRGPTAAPRRYGAVAAAAGQGLHNNSDHWVGQRNGLALCDPSDVKESADGVTINLESRQRDI